MSEDGNIRPFWHRRRGHSPAEPVPSLANGGGGPHNPGMNDRIARLEGAYDSLKVVRPMTVTVVGVFLAAMVFMLSFLSAQVLAIRSEMVSLRSDVQTEIRSLRGEIATIRSDLQTEFRAQRAEMAAQTNAIANVLTAARQQPPQVILVPATPQVQGAPQPSGDQPK